MICEKHNIGHSKTCPVCDLDEPYRKQYEFEQRERRLASLASELPDMKLIMFALWEIHAMTADSSDLISVELLRRSGVPEDLATW